MMKGIIEGKLYDPSNGGTLIKITTRKDCYISEIPHSCLKPNCEIEFEELDRPRNGLTEIKVLKADFSAVIPTVTRQLGLSSDQAKYCSKVYSQVKNVSDFRAGMKDTCSEVALNKLSKTLYGFNFLLWGTQKYTPYGLTFDMAEELFESFGFRAFHAFESNPYGCIGERLTFPVADQYFYRTKGIFGLQERFEHIAKFVFKCVQNEGSTTISPKVIADTAMRTGISFGDIDRVTSAVINEAWKANMYNPSTQRIIFKERYSLEKELAGLINSMKPSKFIPSKKISEFREIIKKEGINLSEGQALALDAAVNRGTTVCVTGGPGTGKTTVLRTLIRLMRWATPNLNIKLAAPTGKAAKRLAEATAEETCTIHKLLEPKLTKGESGKKFSFGRNETKKIECDVLLIDESSMVDTELAVALYKALKPETLLVFIGDVDQLPSVGAGQVYHDIIMSGKVPVFRLTKTMRQADGSLLLSNIHSFRDRRVYFKEGKDFQIIRKNSPKNCRVAIMNTAVDEYKKRGLEAFQVLVPQHYAVAGTENLNRRLQGQLNPNFQGDSNDKFFVGDKVIFLKNNYNFKSPEKTYLNGDTGVVVEKSEEGLSVKLFGEDRIVFCQTEKLDELDLAYAITVHKSQGSEYPSIVVALLNESKAMLTQNWVYTAISRAKELCTIVAEDGVFEQIGGEAMRETTLKDLL